MKEDCKYMQAALRLAQKGLGSVEPNPAVGCVIVKANQIIGKGYHKKFGEAHAEINALEDCKSLGVSPEGATMYVTLEPCCHEGKTGPCTDAIIAAKITRVVIAAPDPSKHADGKGIELLKSAGIEVEIGVCEAEAKILNGPFIKFARIGGCWTVLKWAQSIDGKLAWAKESENRWISGEKSREDVHKLRGRVQAILVGIETVLADDPLLTARPSKGKKLTRIVLDNGLRIPLNCKLLKSIKKSPVMIIANEKADADKAELLRQKGAEVLLYSDVHGRSNLYFLMEHLSERSITHLLVEGGPSVIASFLKERLADEIIVYISPQILGGDGYAGIEQSLSELSQRISLAYVDIKSFGDDVRIRGLTETGVESLMLGKV